MCNEDFRPEIAAAVETSPSSSYVPPKLSDRLLEEIADMAVRDRVRMASAPRDVNGWGDYISLT